MVSSANRLLLMAVIKQSGFYHFYKIFCCFLPFSTVLFLKTECEIKREQTAILFNLFNNLFAVQNLKMALKKANILQHT